MLKKTMIVVLGLAANSGLIAGTMGPVCTPGNVTVPCVAQLWDLGAEALYLQSIFGADKSYGMEPNSQLKNISNQWNWGYRLTGSYHFNTGNDVTVNWTHFSTSANQGNLIAPFAIPDFGVIEVPNQLVNRNRLDQVNIVMGQHVDLGLRDKMRFYAGMQYANIQSTTQNYYSSPIILRAIGSNVTLFDNTDYKGFGPSIGIDYSYNITDALSLTANGGGSILYGTTRYHAGYVLTQYNVIEAQVYASKKAIVPGLEAKLGLNYAYNLAQGVVNINAGYQAMNYFNPLNAQFLQVLTSNIASVNYGVFGPYFGLKYVGNA